MRQQQFLQVLDRDEAERRWREVIEASPLGAETVFVGSGIFKSGNPEQRAKAIVKATTHYQDPGVLVEVSENLGEPMVGINVSSLSEGELLETRGW